MTLLLIVHAIARFATMIVFASALVIFYDQFNRLERAGIGIAGGSALITIPAILQAEHNPFEIWASTLFTLGILLFFSSQLQRRWRHRKANRSMMEAAARAERR